jgi:ATP-binding cassette, subfamily B, bacterial
MKPSVVLLRLIRFSPVYFWSCVLFATLLMVVVPIPVGIVSQMFFDALSGQSTVLNVWSAVAVLVIIQAAEQFVGPALGNPWNAVQQKSQVLMRWNLFAAVLRAYPRDGLPVSVGEAISRFRDDPELIADTIDAVCDLIARTVFAVLAAIIMWRISPGMTALLLVPMLLSVVTSQLLRRRVLVYRAASRQATGAVTSFLGELMAGQLAIRVGGALPNALQRLGELGDSRRRVAVRDRVFIEMLDLLEMNLVHVSTGVVLLVGAQAIKDGTFTVGDFALFVVYLDQLTWYPAEIARLISGLTRVQVSFARMHSVVPGEPAATLVQPEPVYTRSEPPPLPLPPPREALSRVEVQRLTCIHPTSGRGVSDVSLSIERGSLTVVTGRVGAGKTTLLQAIVGLLPIQAGSIEWNGREVQDPATFFVPPRVAYTPQAPRLFSESVRDNILQGYPADGAGLQRAVGAAVLERDLLDLERGLETLVGPRGVKLSGGQVQRVALARMFVREAELLVLDDVSSALDSETEAELWARLLDRRSAVTCLVVSHRPAVLRCADQVLVLEDGRVVG